MLADTFKNWHSLIKLNIHISYAATVPLLASYSIETFTKAGQKTVQELLMEEMFIISTHWKNPNAFQ